MDKITNLLADFAWRLQELSLKPIENMEIILPYENWIQLKFEMNNNHSLEYGVPHNKLEVQAYNIKFAVSCKELNDALIKNKLNDCFKILADGR